MKSIVYYTKFSDNEVFSDVYLNIFFNQLYTFIANSRSIQDLDNLLIDGNVSLAMQGQSFGKGIDTIILSTNLKLTFDFLKSSLLSLPVNEFLKSDMELKFKIYSKVIIIRYVAKAMESIDFDGIKIRDISEIIKP